ncbi:MAG: DUF429 domain-containing protein [Methanomassiliicoccales archaeon]
MKFIGIDLGWKMNPPRTNGTAVCMMNLNGEVEDIELLTTDEDILERLILNEDAWVGIDAPLMMPDEGRLRKCERILFSRGIRLLPTNRQFSIKRFGGCRGERLVAKLNLLGFELRNCHHPKGKAIFEVYPYGILYAITNGNVPRYKKGRKEVRRKGILEVLDGIISWEHSIRIPKGLKESILSDQNLAAAGDMIDALLCAVCVYSHWIYIGMRTECLGEESDGLILLPIMEGNR